jgi:hypothetical protein
MIVVIACTYSALTLVRFVVRLILEDGNSVRMIGIGNFEVGQGF